MGWRADSSVVTADSTLATADGYFPSFRGFWAINANSILWGGEMKKNVASQVIGAQMISATDGSAFTDAVSCLVTGYGGAQAPGDGNVTHEGNGFHSYAPTQAETNYDYIGFTFTGTGAIPVTVQVFTGFPQTGDAFAKVPTATQNADELLNRDMAQVSDTNARTPLNALRLLRNKWTSAAGTLTVTKEDDTTSAWTAALSGDANADPVVGSDPA